MQFKASARLLGAAVALCAYLPAAVTAQEFPVHVPLDDWDGNEDVDAYFFGLIVRSGGVGIGAALIVSIVLILISFCFCCPCGYNKDTQRACGGMVNLKPPTKTEKWVVLIVLAQCLLAVVICAIVMGVTAKSSADNSEGMLDAGVRSIERAENWVCNGKIQEQIALDAHKLDPSLSRVDEIKSLIASDPSLACADDSVAGYVSSVKTKLDEVLRDALSFIDGLSPVVGKTADAAANLQAFSDSAQGLNYINTNNTKLNTAIENMKAADDTRGPVVFAQNLQNPIIPIPFDTIGSSAAKASSAADSMRTASDSTAAEIGKLQNDTTGEINQAQTDIDKATTDFNDQVYDLLSMSNEGKKNVAEMKDDSAGLTAIAVGVTAGLCAIFVPFLCCMTAATGARHKYEEKSEAAEKCMKCSACCSFMLAFWVCFLSGLALFLFYIFSDVCDHMLEGTPKSGNEGLLEVNLRNDTMDVGESTVTLGGVITDVLSCDAGCRIEGEISVGCTDKNTLVNIMKIGDEFDFSNDTDKVVDDMSNATRTLTDDAMAMVNDALLNISSPELENVTTLNLAWSNADNVASQFAGFKALLPPAQSSDGTDFRWAEQYGVDDGQTIPPDEKIQLNNDMHKELDDAIAAIDAIKAGVDNAPMYQSNMSEALTDLPESLKGITAELEMVIERLDALVVQVHAMVTFAMKASYGAMKCGWIGESYKDVVDNGMCELFDGFYTFGIITALCCAELYLSILVVIIATRAKNKPNDIHARFEAYGDLGDKPEGDV